MSADGLEFWQGDYPGRFDLRYLPGRIGKTSGIPRPSAPPRSMIADRRSGNLGRSLPSFLPAKVLKDGAPLVVAPSSASLSDRAWYGRKHPAPAFLPIRDARRKKTCPGTAANVVSAIRDGFVRITNPGSTLRAWSAKAATVGFSAWLIATALNRKVDSLHLFAIKSGRALRCGES